jgi:hypothetical protein
MKRTKALFGILTITMALAVQVHAQTFLTNGLVAYYPFNENANDASGNGNNGTVNGSTLTADRFGIPNSAYSFDGVSAQINVPNSSYISSPTNAVTVAAWILPRAYEDNKLCVSKGSHVNYFQRSYDIYGPWADGNWRATVSTPTGEVFVVSSQKAILGEWSHVLMSYDGTAAKLYINGELSGTQPASGTINEPTEALTIGSQIFYAPSDYWFNGGIDDIRIYNRSFAVNEVQQLYYLESPTTLRIRKAVYVDSLNVKAGTNYQVQVSTDLSTWGNYGSVFTATTNYWRSTNYWDADNWGQLFFRLQVAP